MPSPSSIKSVLPIISAALMWSGATSASLARDNTREMSERGNYLVKLGGCNDCHTPGYFLGKPDTQRYLGGSDVGFVVPGLGVFLGNNLTPDKETGLGDWTEEEIVTAIRTGVTPEGRELAPVMPWRAFAGLTDYDARAIAIYLKTLPAVRHEVPGPFGPQEEVPVHTLTVKPPAATIAK